MYTRCPECQTTFAVTEQQLAARGGLVRCGVCAAVFRADARLTEAPPEQPAEAISRPPKKPRRAASARKPAPPPRHRKTTHPRAAHAHRRAATEETGIPTVVELPPLVPRRRPIATALWSFGGLLSAALLAGQAAYFYGTELSRRHPPLAPALTEFCARLGCEIRPPRAVDLIELAETSIAPHPKYENALRLRAALVNRAEFPQPYPLLEVSLTDSGGNVLARRTFAPTQYLEPPAAAERELSPNVMASALLDITNADGKATGYEIRLLARE